MKTCPECAEDVKEAAQVCRFCGHRFDGESRAITRREAAGSDGPPMVWKIALGVVLGLLLTGGIALAGMSIYEGQRQKGPRQDSAAKSQAVILSSLVEQCATVLDGDYTRCTSTTALGDTDLGEADIKLGQGEGEAAVEDAKAVDHGLLEYDIPGSAGSFTAVVRSESGNRFSISRKDASITRSCSPAGADGCPSSGRW